MRLLILYEYWILRDFESNQSLEQELGITKGVEGVFTFCFLSHFFGLIPLPCHHRCSCTAGCPCLLFSIHICRSCYTLFVHTRVKFWFVKNVTDFDNINLSTDTSTAPCSFWLGKMGLYSRIGLKLNMLVRSLELDWSWICWSDPLSSIDVKSIGQIPFVFFGVFAFPVWNEMFWIEAFLAFTRDLDWGAARQHCGLNFSAVFR